MPLVYDAWLDPEKAAKFFFATATGQVVRCEIDARVGGKFTLVDRRDGEDVAHFGTYLELDRPRRIAFSFAVDESSSDSSKVTIDIAPLSDGCHVTLTHELADAASAERPPHGRAQACESRPEHRCSRASDPMPAVAAYATIACSARAEPPAMASPATVSNALITAILDGVGLDASDKRELLAAAGLRVEKVRDINARTSIVGLWRLWDRVLQRTQDDFVGLRIGQSIPADRFGLAVHAAHNSEDLRQSLQRFAKHVAIINGMLTCAVKEAGDRVAFTMRFHWDVLDLERHAVDIVFAALLGWAQRNVSPEFRPCEVQLRHARAAARSRYEEIFDAPVSFGRPVNALAFDAKLLDAPIRGGNPELGSILEHHADLEVSRLPALASLPDRVRQILCTALRDGRKPDLAGVTSELRTSSRALQRKLGEASTSFSQLLDDARRSLAPDLLAEPQANVEQVGYQLGYSEPTAFIRAFKKWYGTTPGRHRHEHGQAR